MTDWRISIELKQYRIEITELAESDMERAADYIAYELKNVIAAKNILRGIRRQINSLADFPQRYELDDDELLASVGIRSVCFKNYKIYYIISEWKVYIVRIIHILMDSRTRLYDTLGLGK